MNVVNRAFAFGAQRRKQQRHAGANVGTRDLGADETPAAHDDRAVRIAQDDAGAHRDEFVGEEESRFEHLLEDHHRPFRLCPEDDHDRQKVGGKERPRSIVDLRHRRPDVVADAKLLIFRHANVFSFD